MDQAEKQAIQLMPGTLALFESVSLLHDAVIPSDVPPDTLLDPAFWAHEAKKLAPWHEIRARSEDGSWMGRYVVVACDRTWAKVKLTEFHQLSALSGTVVAPKTVADFIAAHGWKHRGPKGHSIVRNSDGAVLVENQPSKEAALKWLEEHANKMTEIPKAA